MPIHWTDPCRDCGKQIALDNFGQGIIWAILDGKKTACCSDACADRVASKDTGVSRHFVCPCCGAHIYEPD